METDARKRIQALDEEWSAAIVSNAAAAIGRAASTHERSTSVFLQKDGRWKCVLTQLTPIAGQ